MSKKVMYTHLPQDDDGETSSYFGKSVLDSNGVGAKPGFCKCSLCKVLFLALIITAVSIFYAVSSIKTSHQSSSSFTKEEEEAMNKAVMRPNSHPFGTNCKHPVQEGLSDILLAINFNTPHYSNIPILQKLYKHVFPHQVYCGPTRDPKKKYKIIEVAHPIMQRGFYGYQCLTLAMKARPGFTGYLYINDDMIINWWKFLDLDKSRIWTGKLVSLGESTPVGNAPKSKWWKRADVARRCSEAFLEIETEKGESFIKQYYKNTNNERVCVNGWSDIFYVPSRFTPTFIELSTIFYDHLVFLEAAVQMVLFYLDDKENFILLNGLFLPDIFGYGVDYGLPGVAWQVYNREVTFIHPYKLSSKENRELFQDILVQVSDVVVRTSCLDIVHEKKLKKKKNKFKWRKTFKGDW